MNDAAASASDCLRAAGLSDAAVAGWTAAQQVGVADFERDRHGYSQFWQRSNDLLARLPEKPRRNDTEAAAARAVLVAARDHRERFLSAHAETLYDRLTRERSVFVRLEQLVLDAAGAVPGLTPTREQLTAESSRLQRDKDGIEVDQGIFLAHMLANERSGVHLCHAMLLPRPETTDLLPQLGA